MEVLVTSQGSERIQKRFNRLAHKTGNAEVAFIEIAAAIAEANERSWGRGVKLAESTMEQKAADGTKPLERSGRLKASLTSKGHPEGAIREITPTSMTFGTSIFYARFQQLGTKNMPKHRVLKFGAGVRKLTARVIHRHMMS